MADENGRSTFSWWSSSWDIARATQCFHDFVRNFILSVVVLANSFYCVQIRRYKGLYKPMCLRPMYWTFTVKGLNRLVGMYAGYFQLHCRAGTAQTRPFIVARVPWTICKAIQWCVKHGWQASCDYAYCKLITCVFCCREGRSDTFTALSFFFPFAIGSSVY